MDLGSQRGDDAFCFPSFSVHIGQERIRVPFGLLGARRNSIGDVWEIAKFSSVKISVAGFSGPAAVSMRNVALSNPTSMVSEAPGCRRNQKREPSLSLVEKSFIWSVK